MKFAQCIRSHSHHPSYNPGRYLVHDTMAHLAVMVLVLVLAGCRSADPDAERTVIDTPTVSVELVEDLRLGVDEPFFGWIGDVAVDASGSIYISEAKDPTGIYRYSSSGEYQGNLGRAGEGPGEFRRPGLVLPAGDSTVVVDSYFGQLVIFERDGTPRRKTERLYADDARIQIIGRSGSGYVGTVSENLLPGKSPEELADMVFVTTDGNGIVRDSIGWARNPDVLMTSTDRSYTVAVKPYGRRSMWTIAGDRLYWAWSDSVAFKGTTLSGKALAPFEVAYSPVRLTAAEKAEATERVGEQFRDQLRLDDTRPAIQGLASDDRGRLWVKVYVVSAEPRSTFWIIDPATNTAKQTTINADVAIRKVVADKAYATLMTKAGEAHVVRYQIVE